MHSMDMSSVYFRIMRQKTPLNWAVVPNLVDIAIEESIKQMRVKKESLFSKSRIHELVMARVFISKILLSSKMKLIQVAEILSLDHTSIIHYRNLFQNMVDTNDDRLIHYYTIVNNINKRINEQSTS